MQRLSKADRRSFPVTDPRYRLGLEPPNKGMKLPPEPLARDEVDRLLAVWSNRAPTGVRNRAIAVVLWRCGLRVAEAMDLYPKDVDVDAGTVAVLHGKGDRARVVGLDPQAMAVVQRWLDVRAKLGLNGRHPLFCVIRQPNRGRKLNTARVREAFSNARVKAQIEKRVHPHGLRHTHAVELVTEGVPLHVIRRQLGHTSLATTQRYVDHLRPADLVRAMQARSWDEPQVAAAAAAAGVDVAELAAAVAAALRQG